MTTTLVVVIDAPRAGEISSLDITTGTCERALLVLNRELVGSEVERILERQGLTIDRRLNALDYLQRGVPIAREKFKRFTADWPRRFRKNGKTFKELFVYEHRLSLWWLTELSLKNHEARPLFGYLVKLEALRLALTEQCCTEVVLLVRNPDLRKVLSQLCEGLGMKTAAPRLVPARDPEAPMRLVAGRLRDWLIDLLVTLVALVTYRWHHPWRRRRFGEPVILFHTWYPLEWMDWHGRYLDRYYVDLPEFLAASDGWRPVYLAALHPFGVPSALKLARDTFAESSERGGAPTVFVERDISPLRLSLIYLDPRTAWRYWRLETGDAAFRASFAYDETVNIFGLARYELRFSLLRQMPRLLAQAHRVRNAVERLRPRVLVTYLEMYHYGRAVIYGTRTAGTGTRIVGFQHSRITRNQLHYNYVLGEIVERPDEPDDMISNMPIPDLFFVHGWHAHRVLLAGGFPEDRLCVCGSPRFDRLSEWQRVRTTSRQELRSRLGVPGGKKLVILATISLVADTQQLVDATFDALQGRHDIWLLVKPHPNYATIEEIVWQAAVRTDFTGFTMTGENLHVLAAAADALVTLNSTSGAEAVAIGCPVVNVRLTDVDLSAFVESADVVPNVFTAAQLRETLDALLTRPPTERDTRDLVEGVFYRLDGRAKERMAAALRGLAGG